MQRIFHVISSFDLGGAERVAVNICKSKSGNYEYHLFETYKADSEFTVKMLQELGECNIIYHRSKIKNKKLAILLFWSQFLFIYLRLRPVAIHSHTEVPDLALWIFRKVSWLFFWIKCIYVRTIHNTELWSGWGKIGDFVERYYVKNQSNIAISQTTKNIYEKRYSDISIPIIANGLEETKQILFTNLNADKINILFAGRFEEQKGVSIMIQVFQHFRNNEKYHFYIIGGGSLECIIHRELGTQENVTIYGKIFNLAQYLGSFDYLFMPSIHEGLALMPIEASLAKTPTIINNCPGLHETLPLDWALKVENNSIADFISIINTLSNIDRNALSKQAYEFSNKYFSIHTMQREYESIYKDKLKNM